MSDMKQILHNIIAHATLVLSVALLLLLFADAAYPSSLYVNSVDTGTIMIVYSAFAVAAAILRIVYSFRGEGGWLPSVIIPHGVIVIAVLTLVLAITNIFNRSMGFVAGDMPKLVFACFSVFGLCLSLSLVECIYKEVKK